MAMSTLFTDSKVGQNVGSLFAYVQIMLFLATVQNDGNVKYLVYLLYLFPSTPALIICIRVLTAKLPEELGPDSRPKMLDIDFVDPVTPWLFLILSTPAWLMIYMYLDMVMPSNYGVNRHPCFCCMRSEETREELLEKHADQEQ